MYKILALIFLSGITFSNVYPMGFSIRLAQKSSNWRVYGPEYHYTKIMQDSSRKYFTYDYYSPANLLSLHLSVGLSDTLNSKVMAGLYFGASLPLVDAYNNKEVVPSDSNIEIGQTIISHRDYPGGIAFSFSERYTQYSFPIFLNLSVYPWRRVGLSIETGFELFQIKHTRDYRLIDYDVRSTNSAIVSKSAEYFVYLLPYLGVSLEINVFTRNHPIWLFIEPIFSPDYYTVSYTEFVGQNPRSIETGIDASGDKALIGLKYNFK